MRTRTTPRAACVRGPVADLPAVDVGADADAPGIDFQMPGSYLNRKASARARNAALARASSRRRRYVDPTTCDVDYSAAQLEFMMAMQAYKQDHCRPYPTCNEVLEVVEALGYEKVPKPRKGAGRGTESASAKRRSGAASRVGR